VMGRSSTACRNPLCSCDPCSCDECACGAAKFGALEQRIMDRLWLAPSETMTIRDLADAFPEYAYTTLATVMDRLVVKGVLRSQIDGRTKRYQATGSRGSHTAVLMHEALSADSDPALALRRFAENLSESEVALLRKALDGSERRQPPRSGGR
jgi:predicted transcriptional regulator